MEKIWVFFVFEDVTEADIEVEVTADKDEAVAESCLLGRKYMTVLPAVVTNSSKPNTVFLTKLCSSKLFKQSE